MTKLLAPVSPGEMQEEEFLVPLGVSKYRLAKSIDVPARRIGDTQERFLFLYPAVFVLLTTSVLDLF